MTTNNDAQHSQFLYCKGGRLAAGSGLEETGELADDTEYHRDDDEAQRAPAFADQGVHRQGVEQRQEGGHQLVEHIRLQFDDCITGSDLQRGAKTHIGGDQRADHRHTDDGCGMAHLAGIGLDDRNGRHPHAVGVVRQTKTQAEVDHVEQQEEDHGTHDGALQRQICPYAAADGEQGEPEHGIADPAEWCTDGNLGALDAVDVLLGALHRQHDPHHEGDQEGVGVEEAHVPFHGPGEIPLIGVDLLQCRQQSIEPAGGLHPLIVEGGLQQQGAPGKAVDILLGQLGAKLLIFIGVVGLWPGIVRFGAGDDPRSCVVRCHLRFPPEQDELAGWWCA
ncbi:hypothetical protein AERO8C_40014 [Aeromonas veronii]|uniref:Uncharacterized protein n=1 Tax=Aeromonas veronii TaxID=654 RepID=A0A653L782_AERVE|nr:hypothetical protein AERO8C_40014 [Aeromonas veronii]